MKKLVKLCLIPLATSPIVATIGLSSCKNDVTTKWIGHRGMPSKQGCFENTIESFEAAGKNSSYWGIETDVYPTNEGSSSAPNFVCVHDAQCFCNANASTRDTSTRVHQLSADEAVSKNLIYSDNYPKQYETGAWGWDYATTHYHLPVFSSYLDVCKKYNKTAVIEIKEDGSYFGQAGNVWNATNLDYFWKALTKYTAKGLNYCLISFDNKLLEYMHITYGIDSNHMQMLFDQNNTQDPKYQDLNWFLNNGYSVDVGDYLSPSTTLWGITVTKDMVNKFHNKGLKFNVWTVDSKDRADALKNMGVDYITSDYAYKDLPKE